MDAQDASNSPEWRPNSSLSGGLPSTATSSILHIARLSVSDKPPESSTSSEYGGAMSIPAAELAFVGQDISPWESVACGRLTDSIRHASASRSAIETSVSTLAENRSLDDTIKDATVTIQFNAKWFAEPDLAALLDAALEGAGTSSLSVDMYAAITLIDTVATYSLIPQQSLDICVRFMCQSYYNANRANKTKRLADTTWSTFQRILESHLGGQCVTALLEVVDSRDSEFLESRAGYAQVAGALMIISEKMLLHKDVQLTMPIPGLTELLDSLWGTAMYGSDHLREVIMNIVSVVLTDEDAIKDLDNQSSWNVVLDIVEPCVNLSFVTPTSRGLIDALAQRLDRYEFRDLSSIAELMIYVDLPLSDQLAKALCAPWVDVLPTRDMPNSFTHLLQQMVKSEHYVEALEVLIDQAIVDVFRRNADRRTVTDYVRTFQVLALDKSTITQSANVLAGVVVSLFIESLRSQGSKTEKEVFFDILCKISVRCIDAARALFAIRADVAGMVYFEKEITCVEHITGEETARANAALYDISSLPMQDWCDAILCVLRESTDWDIYYYFLTALPSLLGNHTMFDQRLNFVKKLREVICGLLNSGNSQEPPKDTALTRSDVNVALLRLLTSVLSYHRQFSKQEILGIISTFYDIAGSRDYSVSIPCIHALTICCYELPDLMSSYMDDVIDKMSKMVTQRYLAIHVLVFLAGLSRLPDLFRDLRGAKKIFGVCVSYLQSIRGSGALLLERQQTPSSDQSSKVSGETSDALPQYVYALAHHVIAFWYLAVKPEDRRELKRYITSGLRYISEDGREMIEDQGLVTIDLMDRVDADAEEDSQIQVEQGFDATDGRITEEHRISGIMLITTETALRTGKSVVTVRRASGTSKRFYHQPSANSRNSTISMDGTDHDFMSVFPGDWDGRTYGLIYTARRDSVLGSDRILSLPDDELVARAIQSIDRTPGLDSHKAGVIYIGEGQTTEEEILKNVMGSPDYVEFMTGMGELMRLKNATFNTQGLDRMSDADGQHAVVWHNEVTQLVFHVTTLMPNDPDPNLNTAKKKQHIGNDYVNIIFNNSGAPFNFNTFPSQFSSVYIIISPSARTSFLQTRTQRTATDKKDSFYTIHVMTRPGYPAISSAAEEKVISGASLPGYVRNLALNECVFSAMWAHRDEPGEYPSSWRSRLMQIRRLRERYWV